MTELKCVNVKPNCTGNESTAVFEGNSKCIGSGIQLSDGNTSMSGKSEISSEVGLALNNCGNIELNVAKIRLNGAEDESQQNRTESSCSNTLSIKPSVSLSNPSCQATERGVVDETLDGSNNSDNFNRPSKEEESIVLHKHDTRNISRSAERTAIGMISSEVSGADKIKSECFENKSCGDDSKKFVAGFDLNDDISTDGMLGVTNPVDHTMSSHNVIHVVAKAAISRGLPSKPLKFEGGFNWKGSAKTSAFRPVTNSRNHSSKATGFDLNVLAGEDCDSNSEVSPKRTKGHGFDLNCFYEAADEFTNHSVQESKNPPSIDFKSSMSSGSGTNPGKKDFMFNSEPHLSEHNSMQHVGNKSHAQQCFFQPFGTMQRVPFQPQLPFMSHVLPPQSFPFKNPFHLNGRDAQPYNVDYSRAMMQPEHSRENSYVTEMMNTSMVHSNGPTYFVPKLDIKREDYLSRSGGKMDEPRQFVFLANTTPTEEQMRSLQQQTWFATSAKRKEPEGGLEYYQLGYKQVT